MRVMAASVLFVLAVLNAGCFGDLDHSGASVERHYDDGTCVIVGVVLDIETDDPLPGSKVYLKDTNLTDETDQEGRFLFPHISPGTYEVGVWDTGIREEVVCEAGEPSERTILRKNKPMMPDYPVGKGSNTSSRSITVTAPWPPAALGTPDEACSTDEAVEEIHYWEEEIRVEEETGGNGSWGPMVEVPSEVYVEVDWVPEVDDVDAVPAFSLCLVDAQGEVMQSNLDPDPPMNVTHEIEEDDAYGTWLAFVFLTSGAVADASLIISVSRDMWFEEAYEAKT